MVLLPTISFRYLLLLLVLVIIGCTTFPSVEASIINVRCNKREVLALLDFKKSFTSTYLVDRELFSWNNPEEDCCALAMKCCFAGIKCDNRTGHVVSLDLSYEILMSNQLRPSLLELQHLRRLDLSWNDFNMAIPEFIGSLSKLTYLDLSHAGFHGKVPSHLGNLSSLQTLVLNSEGNSLYVDNLRWISRLSSLERLDMSYVNLSDARDWPSTIGMLPLLSFFNCSSCSLPLPLSDHHVINSSTSLEIIDLSNNTFSSSITSWLMNSSRNLLELYLSYMNTDGPFPYLFQNMVSLRTLKLSGNHLNQGTLGSIGNLCYLKELDVSDGGTNQSLTDTLHALNGCASISLETLHLGYNNFIGTFPSMMEFPSLRELDLSSNQLDSFSPQDSRNLSKLQSLDMSFNDFTSLQQIVSHLPTNLESLYLSTCSFDDVISDTHVSNLSKLKILDLSYNPKLVLNLSKPPFQLEYIVLRFCRLGPGFPNWLLTQKNFSFLDISNSKTSGSIPVGFWKNLPSSVKYLDLSHNNFQDIVPNLHFPFSFVTSTVDLTSNAFYGPIPFFMFSFDELLLSNNHFSSFAPPPNSSISFRRPQVLVSGIDLSDNLLSGTFPSWFWTFQYNCLGLSVANNMLSGPIPSSIGSLSQAHYLSLHNNNFSGEIPSSLKNCTKLGFLDLSENRLTGYIPDWIGENLAHLIVLSLRSNNFIGYMPSTLCHLNSLQILDLSHNKLSGNIPSCVDNFTAMAGDFSAVTQIGLALEAYPIVGQRTQAFYSYGLFNWKGKYRTFEKELLMLVSMDLSNNDLSGSIPVEITSLVQLHSLNLSSNNLSGNIPAKIGMLTSLETLYLAWNKLCGEIPSNLAQITSLSELDVSHNNLSGKIPIGTQLQSFDSSDYAGNLELCGLPLSIKCPGDSEPVPEPSKTMATENQNIWDMQSFYGASGIGFAFGLLAILGGVHFSQFANQCVNSIALAVLR